MVLALRLLDGEAYQSHDNPDGKSFYGHLDKAQ